MKKKQRKTLVVRATDLFDGERWRGKQHIVIEGDRIIDVMSKNLSFDVEGTVTPAFLDPHSHIGMFRAGEPEAEQEGNDHSDQIRPSHDPLNSVYFDDRTFREAIEAGVLYSCIVPGSGNIFGGRAKVIRNFASHRDNAEVLDLGYKMALGYNPRSTLGWKGERPNTRMGTCALLERAFDDVLRKVERAELQRERRVLSLREKELSDHDREEHLRLIDEEFTLEFTTAELDLLNALSGKSTIKVHVHKEDDVLYLIALKEKYDLTVTAEHLSDVHHEEIFRKVKKAGISIVYGPLGCYDYKVELRNAFSTNPKLLLKSGAHFGLMTDHPVIHASSLRESSRFFLQAGMDEETVLSLLTKRNAEVLSLDDQLGTIAPEKIASLLVWNRDPLHLSASPRHVIAEGQIIHSAG